MISTALREAKVRKEPRRQRIDRNQVEKTRTSNETSTINDKDIIKSERNEATDTEKQKHYTIKSPSLLSKV